ncbi:MAG TPA: YIP1 family protein [bacterium]|nr:YIP1 family protein [bacterium]
MKITNLFFPKKAILDFSENKPDLFLILYIIVTIIISFLMFLFAFDMDAYKAIFPKSFSVDWIGLTMDLIVFFIVFMVILLIINLVIKIILKFFKRQIQLMKLMNISLYSIFVFYLLAFLYVFFMECIYLIFQITKLNFNNTVTFILCLILCLSIWIISIVIYFYGIKISCKKIS